MPLVKGICPNCGGILQLDKEKDAAICQYCGTPFIVEKAVHNYNVVNNNYSSIRDSVVNVYEKKEQSAYDYFNRAKACLKAGYHDEMEKNIKEARILEPDNMEIIFWCGMNGVSFGISRFSIQDYVVKYPQIQKWETDWLLEADRNWISYFSMFFGGKRLYDVDFQWWDKIRCDYIFELLNVDFDDWICNYKFPFSCSEAKYNDHLWLSADKVEYILKKDIHKLYNPYKEYKYRDSYSDEDYSYTDYENALKRSKTEIVRLIQKYYPIQSKIEEKICPSCGGGLNFFNKCKVCKRRW